MPRMPIQEGIEKMNDIKEILIEYLEYIHQNTDGECPVCFESDYPVSGDKAGYEEVSPEDAEEYHCDHDENCSVTAIEKYLSALDIQDNTLETQLQIAKDHVRHADNKHAELQDEIAHLESQLADLQWRSVESDPPKRTKTVLTHYGDIKNQYVIFGCLSHGGTTWLNMHGERIPTPEVWMEKPALPGHPATGEEVGG